MHFIFKDNQELTANIHHVQFIVITWTIFTKKEVPLILFIYFFRNAV